MNMKNLFLKTASITALVIVGLLVITGCQGVFEPPAQSGEDGTGTLLVSFNDTVGRTILPSAKLDKFDLTITDTSDNSEIEKELTGGAGVVLPAGTYDLHVKGYIQKGVDETTEEPIYLLVAEGDDTGVVVDAGKTTQASITLLPFIDAADTDYGDKDGNGYFTWDFSDVEYDSFSIAIYDADDDGTGTAVETSTEEADEVTLKSGVYNVKFSVVVGSDNYTWWEILYVYIGLTSKYASGDFATSESLITKAYDTPADGNGYFYLDLNDWKAAGAVGTNVTAGRTLPDKLEVTFDANGAKLNLGLTSAQQALLVGSKYITVTINGTATPNTTAFRFFIGNTLTSSNWNATNTGHQGAISTILGTPKGTDFNSDGRAALPNGVAWLVFQQQAAGTTAVTIESVRIDYTDGDGIFFLDLSDYENVPTEQTRDMVDAADMSYDDGVLTVKLQSSGKFLNIGLTAAQSTSVANAASVDVTVWGTVDSTQNARYYLGDLNQGTWNATSGSGSVSIATLIGAAGLTNSQTVSAAANLKYFVLQYQGSSLTTATFNKIRVAFTNKNWVRPDPAAADLAVIGPTATVTSQTITNATGTWGAAPNDNIELAWDGGSGGSATSGAVPAVDITAIWPATTLLGAYDKYTLKLKAYDESDVLIPDAIQFVFVSSSSNFWNNRIGSSFRALGTSDEDVAKALNQTELEASTIGGIYMQPRSGKTGIKKIVIEEFTLLKP